MFTRDPPSTHRILLRIHSQLNLRTSFDTSFWVTCLVSFFGMLRKSHLFVNSPRSCDTSKHLLRSDFHFHPRRALVTIRWNKTIQFRERGVHLPLPAVLDSPLCPVTAVKGALHFTGQSPPTSQAFAFLNSPDFTPKTLTYPMFLSKLRSILQLLGLPTKDDVANSLRSGGAYFGLHAGVA